MIRGKPLPKSLAVSGTLKLGAKATYADGHVGDLLTTKNVTFTSRDTSTATVSGIQAHISHDDGSEGANVFEPRNYGPKTLKAGTLQCNIFINTTGEVDKTFTPRLYKID